MKLKVTTTDDKGGVLQELECESSCLSCKHRLDDAHLYFPDCRVRIHNLKNKGVGCPQYEFDGRVIKNALIYYK